MCQILSKAEDSMFARKRKTQRQGRGHGTRVPCSLESGRGTWGRGAGMQTGYRSAHEPLFSECGTHKTVTANFWAWLARKNYLKQVIPSLLGSGMAVGVFEETPTAILKHPPS